MRYRVASAPSARVLPTLDGALAVEAGSIVLTAVVDSLDDALAVMAELERRKQERK